MDVDSSALAYLHYELHELTDSPYHDPRELRALPYILFPRIAKLMEDYHQFRSRAESAASPELLEACEAVLARHKNHMVNWSIVDDVVDQVEAAIAKARGAK